MGIAALIYVTIVLGASIPLIGSDVCTQYGMDGWSFLAAPALVLFGLFVIFALAFAGAASGAWAGIAVLVLIIFSAAATVLLVVAMLRFERPWPWVGLFLAGQFLTAAAATFAFCLSLSV